MKTPFTLFEDEKIVIQRPIHWKNYLSAGIFFLLFTTLFIIKAINPAGNLLNHIGETKMIGENAAFIISKIEMIFFAACIIYFFWHIAKIYCIRYYVTNRRIIMVSGFLTIRTTEMLIERCETVLMKQSVYERIFNCADLLCLAPGSQITLDDVADPEAFKAAIMKLIPKK